MTKMTKAIYTVLALFGAFLFFNAIATSNRIDDLEHGKVRGRIGATILHSSTNIAGGHQNAIGNVQAGFISSTDQTKLDGIFTATVQAATTTNLPTYTTSGGPGVGFTLTGTANGALTAIDGVTMVASATEARSSRFLLRNPATASDGGIYSVTQFGDGSHPYIAVRYTGADTAAEIAGGEVVVMFGEQNGNSRFINDTPTSLTMGTSAIAYRRRDAAKTMNAGTSFFDDCAGAGLAAVNGRVDLNALYILIGTGAGITQANPTTAGHWGAYQIALGTGATNEIGIQFGPALDIDANTDIDLEFDFTTTTLSTSSQEYAFNAGLFKEFAASQHNYTNGWGFVYDRANNTNGHLFALTNNAGTSTGTNTDTGVTFNAGQYYRGHIRRPSGEANTYYWLDGALVATHTANSPATTGMAVYTADFRIAGASATNAGLIDSVRVDIQRTTGRAP